MSDLRKIGIVDEAFRLATVEELIAEGTLDRPIDGNHGEQHPKVADYVSEGIPFIMANDLAGGRVDYESCNFITKKQADGLRKGFAKSGDVLVTHKATIGRTALVGAEADPYIMLTPQVTYYRIKNPEVLDNRYLRHYFDNQFFQKTLAIWAGAGATRAYLGITDQRRLPIIVPPRSKQRKIAAILTAYDDLIETNNRCIALLERVAEELYREWFVRMRFPGHQTTKFVKGVPEGWEVRELKECAEVNPSSLGRNDRPEVIHYVDIGSVTTNKIGDIHTLRLAEAPGRAKRRVKHGDIIWSSVRPANRAYCLIYKPIENLIVSTGFAVIRPKSETPFSFVNFVVTSNGFVDQMTAVAKGAAYPATGFDDFKKAKLLWPGEDLLTAFHRNCEPLFQQKHNLTEQNRTLTEARDLLLPRLISGKLSVEDLDIQFPPSMQGESTEPAPANA
ncbi:MAG: restriction endonuclease subunit S [Alphaproteobacteria bacterium]|nr:restriction endonuclease subunit S [Alphaproteobacteria bacterium]